MENYKDAWFELKVRLENFLWALKNDGKIRNRKRIDDIETIIKKMNDFEKEIG
ncbi:hypothetical protein [Bacillus sp. V5-8f]|uniref:hypothetical protein n=1 Tax=Bacillus sp. V5-8f TaxID=2053044 RepID=UPI0015E10BAD|nr:hypothetical protein [Bacillus sp. V5-8f]